MLKRLKNLVRNTLNRYLGKYFYRRFSYAQEAEDLVVERLLKGKRDGFYVEVGCHHPYRFSNTFLFYKMGWRGICIDPLPGTKALFNWHRPRDICIEVGVNLHPGQLTYYMFNEPALNTFNKDLAEERNNLKNYRITGQIEIAVESLSDILMKIEEIPDIDILSVDVEGLDLQVLKSNDWVKFAPRVIIAECLTADLNFIRDDPVVRYLIDLNYRIYAKTGNSIIFNRF